MLNTRTGDVTVVDADTRGGGRQDRWGWQWAKAFAGRKDGRRALRLQMHLIDTASNQKTGELDLRNGRWLSADGAFAVAVGDDALLCLDGATGKVLARLRSFQRPVGVIFEGRPLPNQP